MIEQVFYVIGKVIALIILGTISLLVGVYLLFLGIVFLVVIRVKNNN